MKKILPKETAVVNEIKKYLIYYATQLNSENIRLKDIITEQNNSLFRIIKENSIGILNDINKFWELMIYK